MVWILDLMHALSLIKTLTKMFSPDTKQLINAKLSVP